MRKPGVLQNGLGQGFSDFNMQMLLLGILFKMQVWVDLRICISESAQDEKTSPLNLCKKFSVAELMIPFG